MDPEVPGDLLDRDTGLPATDDTHDVVTDLARVGLRMGEIFPGPFTQSPRYIDQLQAAGPLHRPAPPRDALGYPDPPAPPAYVIDRSGL